MNIVKTLRARPAVRRGSHNGGRWFCLLALTVAACSPFHSKPAPARAHVRTLTPTARDAAKPIELDVLENQVMRFADSYVATVAQVVDDYCALTNISSAARSAAVRWKLSQGTVAYVNATGPNPALNVLDMVVFVTISRMVMEDEMERLFGPAAQPLLNVHRQFESNAWTSLERVLRPELQMDLRSQIDCWRATNPRQRYVAATRLQELAAALGATPQTATATPNNIFRMLYLDPLAGLDPTATAIRETRRVAERAMYYTQRLPALLNWQAEFLMLQLADQPETKQVLTAVDRFSLSAERIGKLADQLPTLVNDQRTAALRQVFDELAAEGQRARDLLNDTRQTLQAGTEMATSVNAAVQALDAFVRSVRPAAPTSSPVERRPFDVLEYRDAAAQIGVAAEKLTTAIATLNATTPQIKEIVEQTGTQSRALVDYIFGRALALVAGLLVAGVIYRWLAARMGQPKVPPK